MHRGEITECRHCGSEVTRAPDPERPWGEETLEVDGSEHTAWNCMERMEERKGQDVLAARVIGADEEHQPPTGAMPLATTPAIPAGNAPLLLTAEEVHELTGRERPKMQARALARMGIPFRTRPNGSLAVARAHVLTVPAQCG